MYNASNNELVRTNTIVKGCIVSIDATPFKAWFEKHYACKIGAKGDVTLEDLSKVEGRKPEVIDKVQKRQASDRKSTRLNSSHRLESRMPSSA